MCRPAPARVHRAGAPRLMPYADASHRLLFSEHREDGEAMFRHACAMGLPRPTSAAGARAAENQQPRPRAAVNCSFVYFFLGPPLMFAADVRGGLDRIRRSS